jgi:two-component system CheB/CheR fusion protein
MAAQRGARRSGRSKREDQTPDSAAHAGCMVAGFGASAGGLEAFTDVLSHMPPDSGMALVFVQHLDPRHSSVLTELLARSTSIPVREVQDGMMVKPNHVYVIPPNANLSISNGRLRLVPRAATGQQMPIDLFLRSLAEQEGSKAIGVILSGTASDGTLGLQAIKDAGGITFCQDPQSAKYDGMPRSAMAAGCVDFVLPPRGIAAELVRLGRHPYTAGVKTAAGTDEPEPDFGEIFAMLRTETGVDFTFYKHPTIKRRILRRMALNHVGTPHTYVDYIRQNRSEVQSLFRDILINVTGFFREPAAFDFLKSRVLPAILRDRGAGDPIRIWVPGCSSGEEAYSVGICVLEHLSDTCLETGIQIFGTDLNEAVLEKARAGIYPENIASEVSADRLRKYFTKVNGSFQITRPVRELCVFARQNVTKDPPFSKLDLVVCRNVLIYLAPILQQKLMRLFHYALKPSGHLVLGISETVGAATDLFQPIDQKQKVYARKSVIAPANLGVDLYRDPRDEHPPRVQTEGALAAELQRKIDQLLLARYCPPGVVVDEDLKILQFRGRTAPFLEHPAGEANLNLLKMSRGVLGMEVRKLVQKARAKNATVHSETLQMGRNRATRPVRISVTPVKIQGAMDAQYVVLFEEAEPSEAPAKPQGRKHEKAPVPASARRLRDLEQELAATKLYLQSVIEEQEATTEELKSANEEIQSSNEELQSTNEELLTAKEELQSTNEELTTVNEELSNLLSSVNIPIVMLGNDLRIRRFTPQAEKVLNLLPADIGRPIGDFRPKIDVPELEQLFMDVIDNLTIRQGEVRDKEGRTYSMSIRPYRTGDNRIDGAVMTLFDITERKQSG